MTLRQCVLNAVIFVGTCESFFSFKSNLESTQPYTTQDVTQPNGRTACYRPIICWRLALWTCVTNES